MKIASIINRHQKDVVEKIFKHCKLWHENDPPPEVTARTLADAELEFEDSLSYDSVFFYMIV